MDRTVAVTGGSGKLGRAVVAALIEEGWTVVIKIAVDHGVVAAVRPRRCQLRPDSRCHLGWSPNLDDARSCPGPGRPESPPATRVVLDSTLTPAAVMIGGTWIG
jgi:NAD(P)-dependent dehydrogenase (short-subunit alcohol dehydrogenase family)